MDDFSRQVRDNLRYVEKPAGNFRLFYLNRYTGITVARSHEGYNHFARWYVRLDGKIKKTYEIKNREEALETGYFMFYEMIGDKIQNKLREGK